MFFTELSQFLPFLILNHSFMVVKYCSLRLLVYIPKLNMKTSLANKDLASYTDHFKLSCPLWNANIVAFMNFRRCHFRFRQIRRTAGNLLAFVFKEMEITLFGHFSRTKGFTLFRSFQISLDAVGISLKKWDFDALLNCVRKFLNLLVNTKTFFLKIRWERKEQVQVYSV